MAVLGSVCILESALANEASLFSLLSLCLVESASGGLPVVLWLAARVLSFCEGSLAAFPMLDRCLDLEWQEVVTLFTVCGYRCVLIWSQCWCISGFQLRDISFSMYDSYWKMFPKVVGLLQAQSVSLREPGNKEV